MIKRNLITLFVFSLLLIGLMGEMVDAYVSTTGLVSEWQLENNTVDSFGDNNGTYVGTYSNVTGKVGSAYYINGLSNHYINVPNNVNMQCTNEYGPRLWAAIGKPVGL